MTMWSVLKKKMTKSAGYEMSDRESDSGDDCVVVLKKYTKIPSYGEGLSRETTTERYENPYEIDAPPQLTSADSNEATTSDQPLFIRTTQVEPTTLVVNNQREEDTARTSRDIENNNHEDEQGFGARYEQQNEDENANGGGGIHIVSRTVSDLRLEETASMRGTRLSPPRMKRREKQVPGALPPHEITRPPRVARSERVNQTDPSYQNLHYDPRRRKKDHAPPPPPPPPLPLDFLSSNSEDETRSRSNSRLPEEFNADNHLYDLQDPATNESTQHAHNSCPSYPGTMDSRGTMESGGTLESGGILDFGGTLKSGGTMESGYLTLEDVRAQLEQARAFNRFQEESDGRSNDSRLYDGGSEITSEAEGRNSESTSGDVIASRFSDVSATTAAATRNQPKIRWKSPTHQLPATHGDKDSMKDVLRTEDNDLDPAENMTDPVKSEPGKMDPVLKSSDRRQSPAKLVEGLHIGRESIEGGSNSGGSTLSAPEMDERDRKRQEMHSSENEPEAIRSSGMRVEVLQAPEETEERAAEDTIPSVCEPTHMSWDELMEEAQSLGIPLYRPAASLCRSDSDRRSSMSSSATSSDLSHASPLQSPKMNRLTGSGPWHRKDNSLKRPKDKSEKKSSSPFKGKFKLQNLFAAKKAQIASSPKKSSREPAQNLRDTDKEVRLDPIPFRASRLREFVRSGLESPVLHHYRSGPPSLRSDRGQNLVAELSETGFRNSTISLRSHVLSSSYSSGSLGSVFSRSSSQTPSSSTSYGKTSASGK